MTSAFSKDVERLRPLLRAFPRNWDGRSCILEMKENGGRWRDMEWIGWYFEYLCQRRLAGILKMPSEKCLRCRFDGYGAVNWDFKAKATKSDDHRAILNDLESMDLSIKHHGEHGIVLALLNVDYNDDDRTFQRWHTQLKGGKSAYELKREERTAISRWRKTKAELVEILILRVNAKNKHCLSIHQQGRNSNGKPRPAKYMLDLEKMGSMLIEKIVPSG